jgi:Mlc titration factor MtfA (ptsG expression regulator)
LTQGWLDQLQRWLPSFLLPGSLQPARATIPEALWSATLAQLPFLDFLNDDERRRLKALSEALLDKKPLAGVGGFEVDDATAALIAAQACVLVLNLDLSLYDDMSAILVHPDVFSVKQQHMDEAGVLHEWDEELAGEALDQGGAVLLSWQDLMQTQAPGLPFNLVIHEFAHKIDMGRGAANGFPPFLEGLHVRAELAAWPEAFTAAYADFCARVDQLEQSLPSDFDPEREAHAALYQAEVADLPLDPYAAHDPAEFFAVASEAFYVAPAALAEGYPPIYRLLAAYYRQDPLAAAKAATAAPQRHWQHSATEHR